jgi:16S rRNA (guanine966-N2)-methyltransferase
MRIVAGRHKGRTLASHAGLDTRPTSDRAREAIFNVVIHGLGHTFDGAIILDMFAGTGALGLEALSRGAFKVMYVDLSRAALGLVRDNARTLGEDAHVNLYCRDVHRMGRLPADGTPATIAFFDPPYGKGLLEPALIGAAEGGWLTPDALCVLESHADDVFERPAGFVEEDSRVYGKTRVRFLRYGGERA